MFPGSGVGGGSLEVVVDARDADATVTAGARRSKPQAHVQQRLAWLVPIVMMALLRRAATFTEKGRAAAHGKLVMAFLQAFLKLIVYTVALVLILSFLGFDITAILAGLGIGGLAIGLAAQHAISDILGGLIIFLERPFLIGDTVKIGESEAAQVVGLTWRITQLRDPDGVAGGGDPFSC